MTQTPQEETPQEETPQEETPQEETPQEETPQEDVLRNVAHMEVGDESFPFVVPQELLVDQILKHPQERIISVSGRLLAVPREPITSRIPTRRFPDIYEISDPGALETWAHAAYSTRVVWTSSPALVPGVADSKSRPCSWARLYEVLHMYAPRYESLETLPHHQELPGTYYLRPPAEWPSPGPDTPHLDTLLSRLNPATSHDRDLLKAALLTLLWGGDPGMRPLMILTSSYGQGAGKTSTAEALTSIVGGHTAIKDIKAWDEVRKHLAGVESLTKRAVVMDNIKGSLDSASLEAMITEREIPIRANHKDWTSRPGILTWIMTANACDVSRDLAQRAVIIKIGKPDPSFDFRSWSRGYIRDHREDIIAEGLKILQAPPAGTISPERCDRWQAWQRGVLSRVSSDPDTLAALIMERRGEIDGEADVASAYASKLRMHIAAQGHDPDKGHVLVPTDVARDVWKDLNEALSMSYRRFWGEVKPLLQSSALAHCEKKRTRTSRGLVWKGTEADDDAPLEEWGSPIDHGNGGAFGFPTKNVVSLFNESEPDDDAGDEKPPSFKELKARVSDEP